MLRAIRRSIRNKVLLAILTTTFIAVAVTGAILVVYDYATYRNSWIGDLASQAEILARATAPALEFDDPTSAQQYLRVLSARPRILAAAIYTSDGRLFATYVRPGATGVSIPPVAQRDGYRIEGNQLVYVKQVRGAYGPIGTVTIRTLYQLDERLRRYASIVIAVMIVSLIIGLLFSLWMQASITRPILAISETAHRVKDRRDYSLRAPKTTEDEVGYLVVAFNDMLAEIGQRADTLERTNRQLEHEMTVRQEAERALRAADQRKDEFLATLAHELRNPLAPMRNGLEILRRAERDSNPAQMARDAMDRQLKQLVRLVDDLLDVARITTGKVTLRREEVLLRPIMQSAVDTIDPFVGARRQELRVRIPLEPVYLYADATRLAQVFVNLLHNASKFTDLGGRLAFEAQREGEGLTVTVSDSGIGIPPDLLPTIFDMFAQLDRSLEREHAGLGVGLSLAKRLVELHDGTIEASSPGPGQGSRFVVRLPLLSVARPDPARTAAAAQVRDARARRVLVADDNQDYAETFCVLLRARGHDVRVAHDGLAAVEVASEFRPEISFLDIGLPKLSGYDVAVRLRANPSTRESLLVAVTGWGQDSDRQRAKEAGFDVHLVKPVDPDRIRELLAVTTPREAREAADAARASAERPSTSDGS